MGGGDHPDPLFITPCHDVILSQSQGRMVSTSLLELCTPSRTLKSVCCTLAFIIALHAGALIGALYAHIEIVVVFLVVTISSFVNITSRGGEGVTWKLEGCFLLSLPYLPIPIRTRNVSNRP